MHTYFITEHEYTLSPHECVMNLKSGLRMFRHPLYCTLYVPQDTSNDARKIGIPTPDEVVEHKRQYLREAHAARDASKYVFIHERPWRFKALLDTEMWCEKLAWFRLAGQVWCDGEGPGINAALWRVKVFGYRGIHPHAQDTMNEHDAAFFSSLPDTFTAYRGTDGRASIRNRGFSWTTSRQKAEWFARRFNAHQPTIGTVVIPKTRVAAAFVGREEYEVIIPTLPKGIAITIETL